MSVTYVVFFFILGLIIGSFLNVVIYRYNTGRGIGGRSMCFSCKRTLAPYDLVPVFSWLFFRGKCRTCKARISWQYPLVELFTGVLFAAVYMHVSVLGLYPHYLLMSLVYHGVIMALLVVILVYDLKHKIIPDVFVYTFAMLALFRIFVVAVPIDIPTSYLLAQYGFAFAIPSGWAMLAGPLLALPFYLLWLVSGGRWMGLGDAKLALGIGWYLGLASGGSAIVFGFWIGAIVSVLLLAISRASEARFLVRGLARLGIKLPRLRMKSEVPFAPFLIAGLLLVFFFGYTVFDVILQTPLVLH